MVSSIRVHSEEHDLPINNCNFYILDSATSNLALCLLESAWIWRQKPQLNEKSHPRNIILYFLFIFQFLLDSFFIFIFFFFHFLTPFYSAYNEIYPVACMYGFFSFDFRCDIKIYVCECARVCLHACKLLC